MAGGGWSRRWVVLAAAAALSAAPLAAIELTAGPAGALTVIPVTTASDGALRAAFTTANTTNDDVEINLEVGPATITLTGPVLNYTGGTGGTHALTVDGNGATVDQPTAGAAVFNASSSAPVPLTLNGLTVTGATGQSAVSDSGGLGISNSTVTGNHTSADTVSSQGGTTTITNTTFSNNVVTASGECDGIVDADTTVVTGSTFTGDSCTGGTDADGTLDTSTTTITDTTLTGEHNTAGTGDANGTLFPSDITVSGSVVDANTNTSSSGEASGIFDSSTTTITGSQIDNNTNSTGSGAADGIVDSSATTVTGSQIDNNTNSTGSGQADGTLFPTTLTLTNSTVANNTNSTAAGLAVGAGINVEADTMSATNSTIANNTNSGTTGSEGGGIFQGSVGAGSTTTTGTGKHPGKTKGDVRAAAGSETTTLVYDTVAGNTATTGANVDVNQLISFGSVVALPQGGVDCVVALPTTTNGFNFSDDATCGFTAPTDHQNAGNPNLGPVADNGGPGPTRLPDPGSPLIDAIPVASCQADGAAGITTDERGVIRPQGAGCEIGAVEVVPALVPALVALPTFTG